jgi:putative membrane protein
MGAADIVPGVSGGTMALIVGIYTRLINAVRSFDARFLTRFLRLKLKSALREVHWRFMGTLLLGIFCAILFFTKVIPLQVYMFTDPELIFGLFFGLIVGSIFVLMKTIDGFNWLHALLVLVGAGIGFWVVSLVPTNTPETPWFVFLSGSIAICAMILPGISGSYILLILQKYDFVLSQFGKIGSDGTVDALLILLPFGLGAVAGLVIFSRVLSWLLDRYEARTLAVLIGFLIGSLYVIWPYQDRMYQETIDEREVMEYSSAEVQQLKENPRSEDRPKVKRVGEVIQNNPQTGKPERVEVLTVKKKLIHSEPYIPYLTKERDNITHFWEGILGMVIGLFMVIGLDYLRLKK